MRRLLIDLYKLHALAQSGHTISKVITNREYCPQFLPNFEWAVKHNHTHGNVYGDSCNSFIEFILQTDSIENGTKRNPAD